ncbi:MAG: uracil-DNA glycosylase [Armatimonadetes bacterium]|nr:uracil-DNA glycosylase [Armatimonadota bacterium]
MSPEGSLSPDPSTLNELNTVIIECCKCSRLVEYRERVAREKRRMYQQETYWGRPVPGLGDPEARVLIVGLAPAAHGANRTGRMFTGDSSGDFLFEALYRTGFANQPFSISRNDGLELKDIYISAAVRCAPPANKPLVEELDACNPYLRSEFRLLKNVRVLVGLGAIGFYSALALVQSRVKTGLASRPKFGHNVAYRFDRWVVIGSYHPSRQNTQTGRLTLDMFLAVFERVRGELGRC